MNATDAYDVLVAHRPTDEDLTGAWTAERSASVADSVLAVRHSAPARPWVRTRRAVVLAAVAAAAAVALELGPGLLPDAAPRASALEQLAETAGDRAPVTLPAGSYLHTVAREEQVGLQRDRAAFDMDTGFESWTDAAGTVWRIDIDRRSGTTAPMARFTAPTPSLSTPDVAFLAGLPTTTEALAAYLAGHTEGSSSADEAVFTGATDMLRSGLASPALARAAIGALARLPEVRTTRVQFAGHDCVQVSFADEQRRAGVVTAVYLDAATGQPWGETTTSPQLRFTRTVTDQGVVTKVPAPVGTALPDASEPDEAVSGRG